MRSRTRVVAAAAAVTVLALGGLTSAIATGGVPNGGDTQQKAARLAPAVAVSPASLETTYVAIAPCRIVSTLNHGGRLANGSTRTFSVRGTVGFPAQGGKSGGCGVPESATSVTASVTVYGAQGSGSMVGFAAGGVAPGANFVAYWSDRSVTANPTLPLAAAGVAKPLALKNKGHAAYVNIDVTGYYVPQLAAFVETGGALTYTSGRATAASHPSTGNYTVTFDRDVSRCSFEVTPYAFNYTVAVGPESGNANAAHVYIHDQSGTFTAHDTSFFILAIC